MIIDSIREYIPILRSDKVAIEMSLTIEDVIVHLIALLDLPRACRAFIRGYSI